ncbi:MAG: hypothetical protein WD075_14420 [Rhodospirillales bacterium]
MLMTLTALPPQAFAAEPVPSLPQTVKPVDRGHASAESCFGASNEKDEDLKTGNEQEVMKILKLMLNPGT